MKTDKYSKLYPLIEVLKSLNSSLQFEESFLEFKTILKKKLGIKKLGILSFNLMKSEFQPLESVPSDFKKDEYKKIFTLLYENTLNFLNNPDKNEENVSNFVFSYLEKNKKYSLYMLPLFIHEELTGMLILSKPYLGEDIYFDDERFLSALVGQVAIFLERTKLYDEIKADKRRMEFLYNISKEISISLKMAEIVKKGSELIMKTFPFYVCAFLTIDNEQKLNFHTRSRYILKGKQEKKILEDLKTNLMPYIENREIQNITSIKGENVVENYSKRKGSECNKSWSCLMSYNDRLSGIFALYWSKGDKFHMNHEIQKIISTAIIQVTAAIQNALQYERIELLSITDPITKLYNHRYFLQTLETELNRFVRYGTKFSLIMSDIDHFKKFNDTYGHKTGDFVLFHVADTLKKGAREMDTVARYGGEEFAVIMPETDVEGARKLAERIRQMVAESKFKRGKDELKVTISLGVAEIGKDMSITDVIEKADQAMYAAKNNGRNIVYYIDHTRVPKRVKRVGVKK